MELVDGLTWFVWGGVMVGMFIAWAKALELGTQGGVSAVVRGVGTFLLCCSFLAVIVWLDVRAKMP